MDEVRVELAGGTSSSNPRRAKPPTVGVLDEDVEAREEAAEDLAPRLLLEVEADRALVAVDREVVGGGPGAVRLVADPRRAPAPRHVALGRLDLDRRPPRGPRGASCRTARRGPWSSPRRGSPGAGGVRPPWWARQLRGPLGAVRRWLLGAWRRVPGRGAGSASGTVMSTTCALVAATRSAGARCTFTPRAPPPIATTSSPRCWRPR